MKTGFPQAMAATIVSTGLMHLHVAVTVIARLAAVMLLQLLTWMLTKSDTAYGDMRVVSVEGAPT